MKKLLTTIFFILFFIYTAIVFVPKKELYYFGERTLQDYKVYITGEKLSDYGLLFSLKNGNFFYDGIEGGEIESVNLLTTLFYNSFTVKNIVINEDLRDFVPGNIDTVSAVYAFWLPHIVSLQGSGEFGEFDGEVNLINRKVSVLLKPSTLTVRKFSMQLRRFLKKTKEGYLYEYSF